MCINLRYLREYRLREMSPTCSVQDAGLKWEQPPSGQYCKVISATKRCCGKTASEITMNEVLPFLLSSIFLIIVTIAIIVVFVINMKKRKAQEESGSEKNISICQPAVILQPETEENGFLSSNDKDYNSQNYITPAVVDPPRVEQQEEQVDHNSAEPQPPVEMQPPEPPPVYVPAVYNQLPHQPAPQPVTTPLPDGDPTLVMF